MTSFPLVPLLVIGAALGQNSPAGVRRPNAVQDSAPRPPRGRDPEKVHDPSSIIAIDGVARFFATGPGIPLLRESRDGKWLAEGRLFAEGRLPAWHERLVPGNRGYLWAPDVARIGQRFFVYYSVSTFGKNTSAIGLAVGRSMDPASPEWQWEDRGPVIASRRGDRFNAIDPAVFRDGPDGSLWLVFGSFWDGIHLVGLDPATGLRRDPRAAPLRLATAAEIEAPFLAKRGEFYYLFVNWGKCCRGVESTYAIRVGRSRVVTGPYVDRNGADLRNGGGTLVLGSEGRWIGPGHASILQSQGQEWLVHHYYDRDLAGRSRLGLVALHWDAAGWPVATRDAPQSGRE